MLLNQYSVNFYIKNKIVIIVRRNISSFSFYIMCPISKNSPCGHVVLQKKRPVTSTASYEPGKVYYHE